MNAFKLDYAEERVSSCEEKLGRLSPVVNQSPKFQAKAIVNKNEGIVDSSMAK